MKKRVLAFGTFDLLHAGHKKFLHDARALGDELFVVVARDKNVLKNKGRLPHDNEEIRLATLTKEKIADQVVLGNLRNKLAIVRKIHPDIIALGFDQKASTAMLMKILPAVKIIRLLPFFPQKFKSSILRQKLPKT